MTTTHQVVPQRVPAHGARPAKLVVTVVDGDRNLRIRGALVHLWYRKAHTNRHGEATIRVPDRRNMTVSVSAPGYGARTLYEPFGKYRRITVRIYRPSLQWPMYGATPSRAEAQTHIALRPPFRTVWAVSLGGLLEFPAVVDTGVAYISNRSGTVFAVSMHRGRVIWRQRTYAKMASSPAVFGRLLVVHAMTGRVYLLDRANGRVRWSYRAGSSIESSPVVRNGVDYFGTSDGRVVALDLRRRRVRWSRSLGAKITSSASLYGGRLFIGDYAGRVWALSPGTGATRWVRSVNGRVYGTVAAAHGRVFVPSSTGGSLTAFSTGGRYLWRVSTGAYVYSSPAVWGGRVFFGSYNGVFYGVAAANGAVMWRVGTGGPISGAAVVVAGIAYAGSFSGRIVGVDTRTGHVRVNFRHGQYVPVSGNGMRLLFHGYSELYAVQPVRALR
ncbi:MAG: PQQ-binding-like beta-propeller repeat protein [Gaiellaceae bacterium]